MRSSTWLLALPPAAADERPLFLVLPSIAPARDTLWTRTDGGDDEDIGNTVLQTDDGGFITVGNSRSFGSGITDICVVKTDASGDTLWAITRHPIPQG